MDSTNESELNADTGDEAPLEPRAGAAAVRLLRGIVFLGLMVCLGLFILHKLGAEGLLNIALVALGLGFVILIHELGHFLVAKWCDVHVQAFSIGFGPPLPGCSFRRGETTYMVAWVPLGGYVKMVGEGSEDAEHEDDPRSFKNKAVWQRMAIISAGVTMNVILGFICFIIVYMAHGVDRPAAIVGLVDAGSPAWQAGLRNGDVIRKINDVESPYFDDLRMAVALAAPGKKMPLEYEPPNGSGPETVYVEPRQEPGGVRQVIGIAPTSSLKLFPRKAADLDHPVVPDSAAAGAKPSFEFGDTIKGCTDPDQPDRVTDVHSYLEFHTRLERLAGKHIVIQVERQAEEGSTSLVDVSVPPAYHLTFGLRMAMGEVAAVREGSPAAGAGVQPGDMISQVLVTEADGTETRYVTSRPATPAARVTVKDLDPIRLPFELDQWAERTKGAKAVTLVVRRADGQEVPLKMDWKRDRQFDQEAPFTASSPMSVPALGVAYRVRTEVAAVEPKLADGTPAPAFAAGLLAGDVIEAIQFHDQDGDGRRGKPGKMIDLKPDQWAHYFWALEDSFGSKKVTLRVRRGGELLPENPTLTAAFDATWPAGQRGLILMPDLQLQKAHTIGQAVGMGVQRTSQLISQIYQGLIAMARGSISLGGVSGPIGIAQMAYAAASDNVYTLIFFLGLISINLAVINFLPIPVLDGGHMVFLIYEKIRGRPASEQLRAAATVAGLALILLVFVFSIWVDVRRWF